MAGILSKRLDFEDVKSYEDLRYELKTKIQKDARVKKLVPLSLIHLRLHTL